MVVTWIGQFFLIALAYLATITLGPTWSDGWLVPNWIAAVLVAYVLAGEVASAVFWLLLGGLLLEFTLPTSVGLIFILLALISLLVNEYRRRSQDNLSNVTVIALGFSAGLILTLGEELVMTSRLSIAFIWAGLVQGIAILLCYALIKLAMRRFRLRSQDSTLKV